MPYNPKTGNHKGLPQRRRSIRLKGYDYSQAGLYFITICVQDRKNLFGKIVDGEMILNDAGKMADNEWEKIPGRFTNVQLHEYIIMPNHFHAIMEIVGATLVVAQNTPTNPVTQNDDAPDIEMFVGDEKGQPQGIAPDIEMVVGDEKRQPQGIAPDNEMVVGDEKGQPQGIAPTNTKTVGDIVGAFQSIVTVEYIRGVKQLGWQPFNGKLWQRNYWEHIIRDKKSYQRISEYIINNPKNWKGDKFYK